MKERESTNLRKHREGDLPSVEPDGQSDGNDLESL
jgi:hypothetical protein